MINIEVLSPESINTSNIMGTSLSEKPGALVKQNTLGRVLIVIGSTTIAVLPTASISLSEYIYNLPISASLEARSFASLGICLAGLAAAGLIVRAGSLLSDSTGQQ